ncbi:DUF6607 family protein [Pontibacter sp. G13]|uniref:DUF6607 family protein n=1 Tax=Pontibacter sp. G13 TaxID=3074898 RepID=UPI00288BB537|nr:DUF6607 family protein [Pontibacter sp. G13]WNJ20545.1 DUF6607 family protein [Pontibacter sp. G13]
MNRITAFSLIVLASLGMTFAQAPNSADVAAIKSMCGCHSITFDYAETFHQDPNYEIHQPYHAKAAAEWIFVEEETEDKIVIQHLLVVQDSIIVKHWRQDWLFENQDIHQFTNTRTWKHAQLPANQVKGQWSQKVYQVDDSPRYQGNATWVHVDGRHFWENTADAPLPRREFSKRSDYQVMERTNRHEILDYGWVHVQDNRKIIREGRADSVLVLEKGLNDYTKIDDSNCQAAMDWWETNQAYWALVRAEWDEVFAANETVQLKKKVDDTFLWKALFTYGDEAAELATKKPKKVSARIEEIIASYLVSQEDLGSVEQE